MASTTWRLGFASSQGGSYVQLTEVAFLDAGGADLSTGGVASSSSAYSASYTAANAFDKSVSTDWCTVYGNFPAWLQYQHGAPVDVAQVRIVCAANAQWLPLNVDAVRLYSGAAQEMLHALTLLSGSFTAGSTVILGVSASVPLSLVALPQPACMRGMAGMQFSGLLSPPSLQRLARDFRHTNPTLGVIADRVMFRASAASPEAPFASGRVWLLRAADGFKAWEGYSDAQGYYRADGLELGVAYIAVAIDPWGNHKAVGAGPVVAQEAA